MEKGSKFQTEFLKRMTQRRPLSQKVQEAFLKQPRHLFIPQYSQDAAYMDRPLVLYNKHGFESTISQPSFVLYLLELLDIQEGDRVFEVGTGSGWNAALMAELVGSTGHVTTMEIIPDLAQSSKEFLKTRGLTQVDVIEGDASEGYSQNAPYNRMIFTAAAPRIPPFVELQIQEGGRVLFVEQPEDDIYDMIRVLDRFRGEWLQRQKIPCHFVAMVGKVRGQNATSPLA